MPRADAFKWSDAATRLAGELWREGVETREIQRRLRAIGCNTSMGKITKSMEAAYGKRTPARAPSRPTVTGASYSAHIKQLRRLPAPPPGDRVGAAEPEFDDDDRFEPLADLVRR
jgi:hypothetical protein